MDECTIEVHHHIPSMYLLVKSLTVEIMEKEKEFSTFDIAMKCIEIHFMNKMGYVTLLKSMHEKFHNGYLTIPVDFVKGDYAYYMDHYTQYLDTEDLDVLHQRMTIKQTNCSWSRNDYQGVVTS